MGKFAKLKRLKKPVEFTVNLFAVSVSAAVWTMPISVLMFGKVSVFSILLSIILSPAVSVLVACALLAVILYGFGIVSIIAYPLTFVCEQLSKYVIFIVGTFSDIPFSSVNARKPYFYIWLALIAVMVIVGYFVKNKANYAVKSAVISLCVLALGFAVYSVIDVNTTVINIYATGGNTVTVKRGKIARLSVAAVKQQMYIMPCLILWKIRLCLIFDCAFGFGRKFALCRYFPNKI